MELCCWPCCCFCSCSTYSSWTVCWFFITSEYCAFTGFTFPFFSLFEHVPFVLFRRSKKYIIYVLMRKCFLFWSTRNNMGKKQKEKSWGSCCCCFLSSVVACCSFVFICCIDKGTIVWLNGEFCYAEEWIKSSCWQRLSISFDFLRTFFISSFYPIAKAGYIGRYFHWYKTLLGIPVAHLLRNVIQTDTESESESQRERERRREQERMIEKEQRKKV